MTTVKTMARSGGLVTAAIRVSEERCIVDARIGCAHERRALATAHRIAARLLDRGTDAYVMAGEPVVRCELVVAREVDFCRDEVEAVLVAEGFKS